jgi:hypothetical protein
MQGKDRFFVWNMIVAKGFQSSKVKGYITLKDSKELPLTSKKVNSLIKQCIIFCFLLVIKLPCHCSIVQSCMA